MNFTDLITLLKTAQDASDITTRREEIAEIIQSIRVMFDFDQQNRAHQYDLWNHCVHTVLGLPRGLEDDMLYLATPEYSCNLAGVSESDVAAGCRCQGACAVFDY